MARSVISSGHFLLSGDMPHVSRRIKGQRSMLHARIRSTKTPIAPMQKKGPFV
jgi:hypothetical protein